MSKRFMVLGKNAGSMKKHIASARHVTLRSQLSLARSTKTGFRRFAVGLELHQVGSLGLRSQAVQQMEPIQKVRHIFKAVSSVARCILNCSIRP